MNINNNKYQQVSFKCNFLFHSIGIFIHVSRTFAKAVFQDQSLEIIDADPEVEV